MDRAEAEGWMREALDEARKAEAEGEVPVGAVLLVSGKIIGRGHSHCIRAHDLAAHAEILALRHGAHGMRNYRLPGFVLFVTIEPCFMCCGALVHARVDEIIFGAHDPKGGAVESLIRVAEIPRLNHQFTVTSGILADECGDLLRRFFESRR